MGSDRRDTQVPRHWNPGMASPRGPGSAAARRARVRSHVPSRTGTLGTQEVRRRMTVSQGRWCEGRYLETAPCTPSTFPCSWRSTSSRHDAGELWLNLCRAPTWTRGKPPGRQGGLFVHKARQRLGGREARCRRGKEAAWVGSWGHPRAARSSCRHPDWSPCERCARTSLQAGAPDLGGLVCTARLRGSQAPGRILCRH